MHANRMKLSIAIAALVPVLAGLTNCGPKLGVGEAEETHMAEATIEKVLNQHTHQLMSIPGVVGTAIGECDRSPCIMVLVVKKTADLMKKIPSKLDGFPVVVEETGELRPLKGKKAV